MKINYRRKFNVTDEIQERKKYLEELKGKLESAVMRLPEGEIQVCPGTTGNSFRYYVRMSPKEKIGTYLGKAQEKLKVKLAQKRYYEKLVKVIDKEIRGLERAEKDLTSDSVIDVYLNLNQGLKRLVEPINIDDETLIEMWLSEDYEGLPFDKDDKTSYYSDRRERMRSKSELLIANTLNRLGIPYRYEKPIERVNGEALYGALSMFIGSRLTGSSTFFGDPVAMDEEEGSITFWHCGMAACDLARCDTGACVGVHPNRKIGPVMDFGCKSSEVATLFRVGRKPDGSFRFFIAEGEVLDKPKQFNGTSIVVKTNEPADRIVEDTIKNGWEPHYVVIYGSVGNELAKLGNMLNVEIVRY